MFVLGLACSALWLVVACSFTHLHCAGVGTHVTMSTTVKSSINIDYMACGTHLPSMSHCCRHRHHFSPSLFTIGHRHRCWQLYGMWYSPVIHEPLLSLSFFTVVIHHWLSLSLLVIVVVVGCVVGQMG